MATPQSRQYVQDMPPKGGYPQVRFKQIVQRRGPPGFVIIGAALGITLYGLYNHVQRKHEQRYDELQDFAARYERGYLIQARERVAADRLKAKLLDQEREIMSDVPGWTAGKPLYYTQAPKPRMVLKANLKQ